jgi:hypothetical protein
VAELVLVVLFASVLIVLSLRANAAFRSEKRLPMQWSLSGSVNWTAPRSVALSFTPTLAICLLGFTAFMTTVSTPRPGQEGLGLPVLAAMGLGLVATHLFHLWLIGRTLRRSGR